MELLYLTHPVFARHETGSWHPERPARLAAAERGVFATGLPVRRLDAEPVDADLLADVHRSRYIEAIRQLCAQGGGALDADTVASRDSWDAALRAAGAGPQAVALLRERDDATAFLAVRPPGHHALVDQAMGFCLFNNVVVTATSITAAGERVAILDWDVHHGNGTQDMTWDDPDVLYISLHQYPFYPMTGRLEERGGEAAEGTVLNLPLPAGTAGDAYREALERLVLPELRSFAPDWVLVSCGFDAHVDDPLADLRLEATDYAAMAAAVRQVVPPNRIVVHLEGGYDLAAITTSVGATFRAIAGHELPEPGGLRSPAESFEAISRVERRL